LVTVFNEITVLAIYVCLYHTKAYLYLRYREFGSYADIKLGFPCCLQGPLL